MRTSVAVLASLALVGGCGISPIYQPPALTCDDGGCGASVMAVGGGGFVIGGGGGSGTLDASVTDGAVSDGGTIQVAGSVGLLSTFPVAATALSTSEHAATGWTVEVAGYSSIDSLTDGSGAFQLSDVPTETVNDETGMYYGLLARPVGQDLGSYQLFQAGGAANISAVSQVALQAALAGTSTIDLSQAQVVVYVMDSTGVGGHPVQNTVVQPVTDIATTVYDATGGILSPSGGSTGPEGVAVVLNLSPGSGGSSASRSLSLQAMHSGVTQTFDVTVFAGAVTWLTILVAD